MGRKKAREIALHLIFEMSFHEEILSEMLESRLDTQIMKSISEELELYSGSLTENDAKYIENVVLGISEHKAELDDIIEKNSHGWSLARISKIAMAILRLALYEMRYVEDVPVGAAINEAVDLAKAYESEDAGAFINGILGTASRASAEQ